MRRRRATATALAADGIAAVIDGLVARLLDGPPSLSLALVENQLTRRDPEEVHLDQSVQRAPGLVRYAHRDLDRAVAAAYGWPEDIGF